MSDLVTRLLSMDEYSSYDPPSVRDLYKEAAAAIAQQEELLKTWAQQSDALAVAIAEKDRESREVNEAAIELEIELRAENERLRLALRTLANEAAGFLSFSRILRDRIEEARDLLAEALKEKR